MTEIRWSFNEEDCLEAIKQAASLKDNQQLFHDLAEIAQVKNSLKEIIDEVDAVDRQVKQTINDRAKALYGSDWDVISGDGFKISRSFTGAVYEVTGTPKKAFLKIVTNADSGAIDEYIKQHSKLPEGIALNENRGESIRITIK